MSCSGLRDAHRPPQAAQREVVFCRIVLFVNRVCGLNLRRGPTATRDGLVERTRHVLRVTLGLVLQGILQRVMALSRSCHQMTRVRPQHFCGNKHISTVGEDVERLILVILHIKVNRIGNLLPYVSTQRGRSCFLHR